MNVEKISSLIIENESPLPPKTSDLNGLRIDRVAKQCWQLLTVTFATAAVTTLVASLVAGQLFLTALVISSVSLGILLAIKEHYSPKIPLPNVIQKIADHVHATISELFALLAVSLTFPLNMTWFDPKETQNTHKPPVLLVHGYLHNSSGLLYYKYRLNQARQELEKLGHSAEYGPVFTINLGTPFHSIDDYAQRVQQKAEEIRKLTGHPELILIGHSMGGLVSMNYAQNYAPENSVKRVITVGSPINGTFMAIFGIFGKCAKQMRLNSSFTQNLTDAILTDNKQTRFCHIGSQHDQLIIPSTSALFPQNEDANSHQVRGVAHTGLLFSDTVIDHMIDFLQQSDNQISV